mgnify:CR=1 FL=1
MRLDVEIELPEDLPEEQRREAMKAAQEAAILTLFRNGAISTRVAAQTLGLTYRAFLDRLAGVALPVARGTLDLNEVEAIRQKLCPGLLPPA